MQRIGAVQSVTSSGTYCQITAYPSAIGTGQPTSGAPYVNPTILASTTINIAVSSGATTTYQPITITPQGTQVAYGGSGTTTQFISINSPIYGAAVQVNAISNGTVFIEIEGAIL